ncbi:MAG: SpoIIE family protein phosphatase [Kiritimatiellae bacterium]|nr:SpoIIE family protein phosphatase [Kiritimatiellia bacterium]
MQTRTDKIFELIKLAVEASLEGVTISDNTLPDNPIIYVNRGFERLTGYATSEVIGRNCRFLQGPGACSDTVSIIAEAIRSGSPCTVELLNERKDGTPFWNRLAITPIHDNNGKVTHFIGIQSDISEMKETQERLQLANAQLEKYKQQMTGELERARQAQKYLLPQELPCSRAFHLCAKFTPADEIGGDFYDVLELRPGVYGLLVADVTGHGISAALLSFMTLESFRNSALTSLSPSETIARVNEQLLPHMQPGTFVTMFYAIYDSHSHEFRYTQAGNPPAVLVSRANLSALPLLTTSFLVGAVEDMNYHEKAVNLMKGDKVIFFTDAIPESMNSRGQMLQLEGMLDHLAENASKPLNEIVESLYNLGIQFSAEKYYSDDCTILGLEILD